MANIRKSMGGAMVAGALLTLTQAVSSEAGTIVLRVHNYTELPSAVLDAAQTRASAIYAAAGVDVVWVNGKGPAGLAGGVLHRDVILLSREMTDKKCHAEAIGNNVLGRASQATKRAYIFVERIVDAAGRRGADSVGVLAKVMAHEVGHLVLPEYSHAGSGIMGATLDLESRIPQRFTENQAELIRGVAQMAAVMN